MKLLGEKAVLPFLVEIDKDNIKMTRIRECSEKAVIIIKSTALKKDRAATAPVAKATAELPTKAQPKSTKRFPSGKHILCNIKRYNEYNIYSFEEEASHYFFRYSYNCENKR